MPAATPARVLNKFRKLHKRYRGEDRDTKFVRFTYGPTDDFSNPDVTTEYTEPDAPVIVLDQPDKELAQTFGSRIGPDQKIFKILADSIVDRLPLTETNGVPGLGQRAEAFLAAHTGRARGGIIHGGVVYILEPAQAYKTLGAVVPQYIVLGTASIEPAKPETFI